MGAYSLQGSLVAECAIRGPSLSPTRALTPDEPVAQRTGFTARRTAGLRGCDASWNPDVHLVLLHWALKLSHCIMYSQTRASSYAHRVPLL